MKGKWIYCEKCNYALDLSTKKWYTKIGNCPNCSNNSYNTEPLKIPPPNYKELIKKLEDKKNVKKKI